MGAAIELASSFVTAEQVCVGLIKLLRKSRISTQRVIVGSTIGEFLPASQTRIAFFPGQPDSGTVRISMNPRMAADEGILLDSAGTTSPLSLFTLAGMVFGNWFAIGSTGGQVVDVTIANLDC